jgi:peptide/nickel transport system permease protein
MLALRKFARDVPAVIGGLIVLAVILVALFAPELAPYPGDAQTSHLLRRLKPPSWDFPFGTDNLGRDIFSRVILGTRGALQVAVGVVGLALAIGVPLGLVAGYYRGWLAETVMRVTDLFLALPQLILALALAQLMTPSLESAMLALALTYWPFFTRIVFAETRRLRAALFVDALRCLGAGGGRILFAAVLGFLGMGATPPDPDWGLAIAESRSYLPDAWWFSAFPGLAIFLTVLGFNLLGDGLRDIADPRLRRSR